ncbi:hypothetical protein AB4Y63_17000 [Leifsonia sp. YAF41]|uniref:hypothetical protein n=1 Tax=Leifsonia sp. YAF41 TaxID=3233086 RepID=UPI003F9C001E
MIQTARKWFRRHPKTTGTVGVAVLALVVASTLGVNAASAEADSRKASARTDSSRASTADGHRDYGTKSSQTYKHNKKKPTSTPAPKPSPSATAVPVPTPPPAPVAPTAPVAPPASTGTGASTYPLHTGIVATTFWVGEIFDANAEDGSQMLSTYDANWFANFGGCDGIASSGSCETEKRVAANGFFPTSMSPKQNPFYLDLPYDDVNDSTGFANRGSVIPWANDPAYAGKAGDASVSLMKNRWVKLTKDGQTCYGQIADAGPGEYHDSAYVFGGNDARPANARYGGAGMDVSPALNGCLNFAELDGDADKVDWQFVEAADVPAGPWLTVSSSDNKVIN